MFFKYESENQQTISSFIFISLQASISKMPLELTLFKIQLKLTGLKLTFPIHIFKSVINVPDLI